MSHHSEPPVPPAPPIPPLSPVSPVPKNPARVLVLGGVSLDLILALDDFPPPVPHTAFARRSHETIGSTGAGKALNLARLGLQVTLHAMIGDDVPGHRVGELLRGQRIDFLHDVDPAGTQRHVNLMDQRGQRISIYLCDGTFEPVFQREPIVQAIARADLVVLNIRNYCRHLIPDIQAHGKPIWVDIHDYDGRATYHHDFITAADYLFASSQSLPDHRSFMERMIASGKNLAVCTHGAGGATALTGDGQWIECPIVDAYPVVDTNGAGDAFFAGYLHGHCRGEPARRCMELATLCAGLCVSSHELHGDRLDGALLDAEHRRHYGG